MKFVYLSTGADELAAVNADHILTIRPVGDKSVIRFVDGSQLTVDEERDQVLNRVFNHVMPEED